MAFSIESLIAFIMLLVLRARAIQELMALYVLFMRQSASSRFSDYKRSLLHLRYRVLRFENVTIAGNRLEKAK